MGRRVFKFFYIDPKTNGLTYGSVKDWAKAYAKELEEDPNFGAIKGNDVVKWVNYCDSYEQNTKGKTK